MTTLVERPTPVTARSGGSDARRALIRWAWRLFRREWRQQVLALALLLVAVAATVVGLGVVTNVQSTDAALFGTANTRVDVSFSANSRPNEDIAHARQAFGTVDSIEHATIPIPGSINTVDLRDQAPNSTYARPMLRLVNGEWPVGPNDVAVTSGVATTFGLHVGSTWIVNGRTAHVVGTVENPKNLQDDFALVAPGQIAAPTGLTLLTNASNSQLTGFRTPGDSVGISTTGVSGPAQRRQQSLAVLLLATIGLLFVGLLSVAGFTVMAQRRMRALGMIGAIGATDRQVRLVMVANGAAVGVVGALAGTVIGFGVWLALVPAFEHVVGHRFDAFNLDWWAVGAAPVLAVVTAVLAAWWPARAIARMPIVTALSGRPARPRPAHRFAALGSTLTTAGFVLLVIAHQRRTVLIVAGIVLTAVGMLLLAPLGIRALASMGRRSPIAIRLALRDLARYQARSGAALAAVSLAVGIAATIAVSASAQAAADKSTTNGNLPPNQLAVWIAGAPGPNQAPDKIAQAQGRPAVTPAQLATLQASVDSLAGSLHTRSVLPLEVASNPRAQLPSGGTGLFDIALVKQVATQSYSFLGVPIVATPALLNFYRIPSDAIRPGTDILITHGDLSNIRIIDGGADRDVLTPTVQIDGRLPAYSSAPNIVITPHLITTRGLTARPVGWLVQTAHPLTTAQITTARHAAAAIGMTIETRTASDHSLQNLRDYSTAAGLLVALGVLAMTVGLIRSETANDLRTLSATGATSRTRRTLTSATAGALGLLGGLLGTLGAYLALVAWHWHKVNYLAHPPYLDVAVLVVGLPAAAIVGGWLAAWRAPTGIAHRPME